MTSKKFADLRAKMSPEAQARSKTKAKQLLAQMPLHELRQARGLTQKDLAEILQIQQPSVAKLERRTDMHISTLQSHIEALGGELDMIARFPEGTIKITNFTQMDGK